MGCNACVLAMPPEHHQVVVAMIDGFYKKSNAEGEGGTLLIVDNVCHLIKYAAINNIVQLQRCYQTTKTDPSVMIGELNKKAVMEVEVFSATTTSCGSQKST